MKLNDNITIGDMKILCIGPTTLRTLSQTKYPQNYNSLNFILTYGNNKFMFTGDYMQSDNILKQFSQSTLKIDVLKYDSDPTVFIKNALSPAEVSKVIILDADKKQALAIVPDTQFSLAIGKQGQNVRLANKLCDWTIDVKTEEQAADMDLSEVVSRQAALNLFKDDEDSDDDNKIVSLPGIDERTAEILKENGIVDIQQFVDAYEEGTLDGIDGLSKNDIEAVNTIISENVEIVEEGEEKSAAEDAGADVQNEGSDEDEYFCPECGAKITLDMTHCPKCGVEFEFTEDE